MNDSSRETPVVRIKKATVALALVKPITTPSKEQPFKIVGSGFCVHPDGVVVTCKHVAEVFMSRPFAEHARPAPGVRSTVESVMHPFALFFLPQPDTSQIIVEAIGVTNLLVRMSDGVDVAMLKLNRNSQRFAEGFPTVTIDDAPAAVCEGDDVAVCGFPNGNQLMNTLGTVSSSFSRGIISSIVPAAGVPVDQIKGFQLDLRATHGNSGGPLFSWSTGNVLGILQGGVDDTYGKHLFSYAESIHRALAGNFVEQMLKMST